MSSQRFEGLEEDVQNIITDAKLLCSSRLITASGEEKKSAAREVNRMVERGQLLVQEMESELMSAPGAMRIQMNGRLGRYKSQLEGLTREVGRSTGAGGFDNLGYGMGSSFASREEANRARLMEGHASLQRASDSIARSHVISAETDEIGVGVISELGEQRDQLERTRDRLIETQGGLGRSRRILKQMGTRIITNKILLVLIIIVELGILAGVVYWKFFSKK